MAQRTVKRIDECVREQEQRDHEELLSRARRASKHAQRASAHASALIDLIKQVGI